jgi:hypothetical protein
LSEEERAWHASENVHDDSDVISDDDNDDEDAGSLDDFVVDDDVDEVDDVNVSTNESEHTDEESRSVSSDSSVSVIDNSSARNQPSRPVSISSDGDTSSEHSDESNSRNDESNADDKCTEAPLNASFVRRKRLEALMKSRARRLDASRSLDLVDQDSGSADATDHDASDAST